MTARRFRLSPAARDRVNFWVTNRVPRRSLTRFVGWFSRIEQPWVRDLSMAVWRKFADVDLSDAYASTFRSVHDCFTRELAPGARTIDADPAVVTSPCDAIVGACGTLRGVTAFQAKGATYPLHELLVSATLAERLRDGCFVTLRLTSSMYHRFHAPYRCRVGRITYVTGDVWNVNPPALARVDRLYCRNERAVIETTLEQSGYPLFIVPVGAILVASIRFAFLDVRRHVRRPGPNPIECDERLDKGEQMGWFEHGSTIIVFAPRGFSLVERITPGQRIRVGNALMRLPEQPADRPAAIDGATREDPSCV
jgi:phosphatidylserine decarboxylase